MQSCVKNVLFTAVLLLATQVAAEPCVSTLAGSGVAGFADGTGTAATFNGTTGITVDAAGNVYLAEPSSNRIRKITPAGIVTTIAGSGAATAVDGTGTAATFSGPHSIDVDASGNLFVADTNNFKVRKITSAGVVSTYAGTGVPGSADGNASAATFFGPVAVATDASGNTYVLDLLNYTVRKITSGGVVSTLAGSGSSGSADGTGSAASFSLAYGLATDSTGNVYVADTFNNKIRKITSAGVTTTFAGTGVSGNKDGPAASATFSLPTDLVIDASGNVFVLDSGNSKIRKIAPDGTVSSYAGGSFSNKNGAGSVAGFQSPFGLAADSDGNLYVADGGNNLIRKVTPSGCSATSAGNSISAPAMSAGVWSILTAAVTFFML